MSVHVCIQGGDGLWVKAVSESVCPRLDTPVASSIRQQVKQNRARVSAVLGDPPGSAKAAGSVNVHQGG